ncbi:MAG: hypothetical protein E4H01_07820 [Lysobacterales bacterium]|nr:MAG: hypothetical protein E4H01_07820 [Xanthomonadales bacterium]
MSCPECNEYDKQTWYHGYAGDAIQPEEPAHYECAYCGHCYLEDPGDRIDAAYEDAKAQELNPF